MIAVTFALPSESSAFVRCLTNCTRSPHATVEVSTGDCGGERVSVLHTGVGEKSARARLSSFLGGEKPRLLISSGFAGALHNSWKPGELLIARNVSSEVLQAAAQQALPNVRTAALTTARIIVDSSEARAELARQCGADVVDMETASIAEACAACGIPLLSLRVISDTPERPLPAPPGVLYNVERQRTEFAPLFWHIATTPSSVPRFLAFARQITAARAALAEALCTLIRSGALAPR